MPRSARIVPGGLLYHALNRPVARLPLFENEGDYEAPEQALSLPLITLSRKENVMLRTILSELMIYDADDKLQRR